MARLIEFNKADYDLNYIEELVALQEIVVVALKQCAGIEKKSPVPFPELTQRARLAFDISGKINDKYKELREKNLVKEDMKTLNKIMSIQQATHKDLTEVLLNRKKKLKSFKDEVDNDE